MDFKDAVQQYDEEPLTRQLLLDLLKDYKRPFDKISELVKNELLTPVKRGLYVAGNRLRIERPGTFLLANHLHGPSYVSLESALAYYGMIPERVYETTSVTTASTKTFSSAVGRFSYQHIPLPYYSFGITIAALSPRQSVQMASPEKALCDKIITTSGVNLRSIKQTRDFLIEDLRIDEEQLETLDSQVIASWIEDTPKKSSIKMLVKTLHML